jgi:hypothetical protein
VALSSVANRFPRVLRRPINQTAVFFYWLWQVATSTANASIGKETQIIVIPVVFSAATALRWIDSLIAAPRLDQRVFVAADANLGDLSGQLCDG